jgi:hypothetical protein
MTVRMRVVHAGKVQQFVFDRREISIGRGPLNDVALRHAEFGKRHGTVSVSEAGELSFEDHGSPFATRILRDGEVIVSLGAEAPGTTAELEVGDILELGPRPSVRIEIEESCAVLPTTWRLHPTAEPGEVLRESAGGAEAFFEVCEQLSHHNDREVLLRGLAELSEECLGHRPARIAMSVLTEEEEFHDDVWALVERGGGAPEVGPAPDPLHLLGPQREVFLERMCEVGPDRRYAVILDECGGLTMIVVIGCEKEEVGEIDGAVVISIPGREDGSMPGLDRMGRLASLLSPPAKLWLEGRRARLLAESLVEENAYFRERERRAYHFKEFVCVSEAMQHARSEIDRRASSEEPVLVVGEAGTGKELFARALHHLGPRSNGMLIRLEAGRHRSADLEEQLFGYAVEGDVEVHAPRKGAFELARGGTIYLEEVERLSRTLQGKLVRVLNEHEVRRLGESVARHVDARLIVSTYGDLEELVETGALRRSLYLLLRDQILRVPSLRERREDIVPLAEIFREKYRQRYGRRVEGFEEEVLEALVEYDWPGNVRQLITMVEAAVLRAGGESLLRMEHFLL